MTKKSKLYQDSSPVLQVTGVGEVQATADIARLSLGVITEAATAQEAAARNAELMQRVIAAILDQGIPEANIQTTGLNLYPVYEFVENKPPRIVAYRAENTVEVTTTVEQAGPVFDAAVAAGANTASSLTFDVKDRRLYRERALMAAVTAAREDAAVVSMAAGVELGCPVDIQVQDEAPFVLFKAERVAADTPVTPVLPGPIKIVARVSMRFAILCV